jgi:hypothetical protein
VFNANFSNASTISWRDIFMNATLGHRHSNILFGFINSLSCFKGEEADCKEVGENFLRGFVTERTI